MATSRKSVAPAATTTTEAHDAAQAHDNAEHDAQTEATLAEHDAQRAAQHAAAVADAAAQRERVAQIEAQRAAAEANAAAPGDAGPTPEPRTTYVYTTLREQPSVGTLGRVVLGGMLLGAVAAGGWAVLAYTTVVTWVVALACAVLAAIIGWIVFTGRADPVIAWVTSKFGAAQTVRPINLGVQP